MRNKQKRFKTDTNALTSPFKTGVFNRECSAKRLKWFLTSAEVLPINETHWKKRLILITNSILTLIHRSTNRLWIISEFNLHFIEKKL